MAATELLAVGNTAADSDDFEVGQGESALICLKGAEEGAEALIALKDDGGEYTVIGRLNYAAVRSEMMTCIFAPGTFRVERVAGKSCGVFRA